VATRGRVADTAEFVCLSGLIMRLCAALKVQPQKTTAPQIKTHCENLTR